MLVALNKKFVLGDHDFAKFSLTLSVCLLVDIPDSIDSSFYQGNVYIGLKENVFQPSSPIRHMIELKTILDK